MEIKSCHNCKHWSRCLERGRGACGDYQEKRPRQVKKESKCKGLVKDILGSLLVVGTVVILVLM